MNKYKTINGVKYEIVNGVKYPWDPVTKMYVGWWATNRNSRKSYRTSHINRLDHRIKNWDDLNKIFSETEYPYRFNGYDVYDMTPELRDDSKVLEKSIELASTGWCICIMSDRIQRDPNMAKIVLRNDPTDICYLRKEHLDNYDVMLECVKHKQYGNMIREASERLKNDKSLAIIGLTLGATYFCSLGDEIKDDEEMLKLALKREPDAWKDASKRLSDKYRYSYKILKCNLLNYFKFL